MGFATRAQTVDPSTLKPQKATPGSSRHSETRPPPKLTQPGSYTTADEAAGDTVDDVAVTLPVAEAARAHSRTGAELEPWSPAPSA